MEWFASQIVEPKIEAEPETKDPSFELYLTEGTGVRQSSRLGPCVTPQHLDWVTWVACLDMR